jgi:hypothetical protein
MFADSVGGTPATNGNPVQAWEDQSGAGNHFTEPTNYPVMGANGELAYNTTGVGLTNANKASWTFLHDGSSFTLVYRATYGLTSNPGVYMAMLGNSGFASSTVGIIVGYDDSSSANDASRLFVSRGVNGHYMVPSDLVNNALPANTPHVVVITYDSSTTYYTVKVDNVTVYQNAKGPYTHSSALSTYNMTLGGRGSAYDMLGSIEEVIIYDELLSASDQDTVYNALNNL